jgi:hypothetical protein
LDLEFFLSFAFVTTLDGIHSPLPIKVSDEPVLPSSGGKSRKFPVLGQIKLRGPGGRILFLGGPPGYPGFRFGNVRLHILQDPDGSLGICQGDAYAQTVDDVNDSESIQDHFPLCETKPLKSAFLLGTPAEPLKKK